MLRLSREFLNVRCDKSLAAVLPLAEMKGVVKMKGV
jgi:hypothetical protein